MTDDGSEMQAVPRRPGSSRYRILPSIGQTSGAAATVDDRHLCTVLGGKTQSTPAPSVERIVDGRGKASTKSHSRRQQHVKVAGRQGSDVEAEGFVNEKAGDIQREQHLTSLLPSDQQVILAVKLPSGQRIEHRFQRTEKLFNVLRHVEVVAREDFTNCEFVSADRRKVLSDLNQTIASAGVPSRSVLYLQLPDDQ